MGRGRAPCCDKSKVRTGPWSPAEDLRLMNFIQNNGHSNWRALPKQAGLLRCGKSCRLRWINYLRPDVKRGNFTPEEENTIIQLHNSIGNKWSKIASCLPGRTDNEIKNVWNTHLKKRVALNHSIPKMDSSSTSTSSSSSSSSDEKHMHAAHDSPSPSSSATDNPKHATNPMESEFDLDFWEGLDSLEADEENAGEVGKWLRMLENELGVANNCNDGDGDGDGYQPDSTATLHHEFLELSTIWPCSPAHQYLGI